MNIDKINNKLKCYIKRLDLDYLDKNHLIDLIEYFKINKKINTNDDLEYLYRRFGRGMSEYCFGMLDGEERVYFDSEKNKVIYYYNDWHRHIRIDHEYEYDQVNDRLIDEEGKAIPEDFILLDVGKKAKDEFLKYYKACKNSKPYFKPLNIVSDLYIDSELNLYTYDLFHAQNEPHIERFFESYKPKIIVNLNDLIEYLLDKNNKNVIELEKVLKSIKIKTYGLPNLYKETIEKEKCNDKTYLKTSSLY